jgi:D,D-heptose 1,7-bisphosphate phosphatase
VSTSVRQCAVLVGGEGTRLGALTKTTPKPLLPCGDRPFLAWLLREFIRFGVEEFVLLTGYLSGEVGAALPTIVASLPKRVKITVSHEVAPAGTGGALHHARDLLAEQFLLCNGDSMLDFNLSRLLADASRDGDGVVGRLVLRRLADASRYGVVETDGDRVTAFRERPAPGEAGNPKPGTINAGIYLFRRRVLDAIAPVCSLERDVMPKLAAEGALRGTVGEGYFIDIGIPADLERAQAELPAKLRRAALFLARDGVINVDHGYVETRERFEWNDGALAAIRFASDAGAHVFVVTNQSCVARGFDDEIQLAALHAWMTDKVRAEGGTIDDLRSCPFHPEGTVERHRRASNWRKQAPGMLLDLMTRWELDPARCVMIGDQPTDLAAAQAAGARGVLYAGGDLLALTKASLAEIDASA